MPLRTLSLFLFLALGCALPVHSMDFPAVPTAGRILSAVEVEHFWFNTLRRRQMPSRPNSLHPAKQAAWDRAMQKRNLQLNSLLTGQFRTEAQIAALQHNIQIYRENPQSETLAAAQRELEGLLEHQRRHQIARSTLPTANAIPPAKEAVTTAQSTPNAITCEPSLSSPRKPPHHPSAPRPPTTSPRWPKPSPTPSPPPPTTPPVPERPHCPVKP